MNGNHYILARWSPVVCRGLAVLLACQICSVLMIEEAVVVAALAVVAVVVVV